MVRFWIYTEIKLTGSADGWMRDVTEKGQEKTKIFG